MPKTDNDVHVSTPRRRFLQQLGTAAGFPAILTAGSERPNIVWIMSDEQRPDSLGCYGSAWAATPNLDRLADDGVLFENAYTPSPVCVPARCSLLTGNFGSTLGVLHNQQHLAADARFLTWDAEQAGYRTASFGKKHYTFPRARQAFQTEGGRAIDDVVDAEGYPDPYRTEDYDVVQYPGVPRDLPGPRRTWILAGTFPAPKEKTAEAENVDLAMEWLSCLSRSASFFLRLSMNAPHTPVVVPSSFLDRVDPDAIDLPLPGEETFAGKPPYESRLLRDFQGAHVLTRDQIRKARHYYYARVAFLDFEIGRFVDWMDRRSLLDNTIVAFLSDHGTHLGDHGLFQKQTFYEQVVTVPYFFWWRKLPRRGLRIKRPVNVHTLLPTLLDLAGVERHRNVDAPSLAGVIRSHREPLHAPVFSELKFGYQGYRDDDRLVMARDGPYKLSLFQHSRQPDKYVGREEGSLYDMVEDPREERNLYSIDAHQDTVSRLREGITNWDRRRVGEV